MSEESLTKLLSSTCHSRNRYDKRSWYLNPVKDQFSSVAQSCPTLCFPMDCSMPGLSVYHQTYTQKLTFGFIKLMSIELVMPSNHLILCHPFLLLPSIVPSIRVSSNKLVLCIRWPEYWCFSFSISPSNEYSGPISFWPDWFDLLAVQWILKILLQTTVQRHQFFSAQLSL